ncbi:hypothetical protein HPB50_021866 [Hyalomma asiaticum]|uniref:Uncharacterized protein n=1 Tax=Hyalomma asiaticum TaxID=266040 RepID=A0ACB7T0P6_HYAAI|nr:hypothetical protein HPB50_021866 [Hyalomma asiaticum]
MANVPSTKEPASVSCVPQTLEVDRDDGKASVRNACAGAPSILAATFTGRVGRYQSASSILRGTESGTQRPHHTSAAILPDKNRSVSTPTASLRRVCSNAENAVCCCVSHTSDSGSGFRYGSGSSTLPCLGPRTSIPLTKDNTDSAPARQQEEMGGENGTPLLKHGLRLNAHAQHTYDHEHSKNSDGESECEISDTDVHRANHTATSAKGSAVALPSGAPPVSPGRKQTISATLIDESRLPSSSSLPKYARRSSDGATPHAPLSGSTSPLRESDSNNGVSASSAEHSLLSRRRVSVASKAPTVTSIGQTLKTSNRKGSLSAVDSSSSLSLQNPSTSNTTSSTSAKVRRLSISKGLPKRMTSTSAPLLRPSRSASASLFRHSTSPASPSDSECEGESGPRRNQRSKSVSFSTDQLSRFPLAAPECKPFSTAASPVDGRVPSGGPSTGQTHSLSQRRRHSAPSTVSASSRNCYLGSHIDRRQYVPSRASPGPTEVPPMHQVALTEAQHKSDTDLSTAGHSAPGGVLDVPSAERTKCENEFTKVATVVSDPTAQSCPDATAVPSNHSSSYVHQVKISLPQLGCDTEQLYVQSLPYDGNVLVAVTQTTRLIARVSARKQGMKEKELLQLIHAFVISRLTYALPYLRLLSAEKERINRLIRKVYKTALGLTHSTSTSHLLSLGLHNTLEELIEAHRSAQIQRLHVPKAQQENCSRMALVGLALAVLLLAGAAATVFLFSGPRALPWSRHANQFCGNSDCTEHVARLGLDPSLDTQACDDFGVFVCSGWKSRKGSLAPSVVSEWLDGVGSLPGAYSVASKDYSMSPLWRRPAELMAACMRTVKQGGAKADVLEFTKFMASVGLSWHTEEHSYSAKNYSAPLKALVDLAFRWNLPLWFRVELLHPYVRHSRKRTIYVTSSPLAELCDRLRSLLLTSDFTYAAYMRLLNATLLNSHGGPKPTPSFMSFLESGASATLQKYVFGNLSAVALSRHHRPKVIKIRHLSFSLKGVTLSDWLRILQDSIRPSPPLTDEDALTLRDKELLKAVNRLFMAYSPRDILHHTSWWLLQFLGPLVSDDLFSLIHARNSGKTFLRILCAVQLEATYSVLLSAMSESRCTDTERLSVERHLQNVRNVALERLSYAGGLTGSTKRFLTSALEKTDTIVWLGQFPLHSFWQRLTSIYDQGYSVNHRTFFTRWLSDRIRIRESSVMDEPVALARTFTLYSGGMTSHNAVSQDIFVSAAALRPPFYYAQGTTAMLYGGLGYLYAREIFQLLSSTAELLNGVDGWQRRLGEPAEPGDAVTLWELFFSCPRNIDKGALYPELPALRVAYETYTRFRNSSTDVPLVGLEGYSTEQVFFLTFCHSTCEVDSSGQLRSQYCSDAVKNFAPFAAAFSCSPGSEMNIDERCEYL